MALTNEEKALLREVICKNNMRVTPKILSDMAAKTDEEIRVILASEKAAKIAQLNTAKASIEAKLAELQ